MSDVLAVVPARLTSHRAPGKVLRPLGRDQWPLLWYTLAAGRDATKVDRVVVTTSAGPIAGATRMFGGVDVVPESEDSDARPRGAVTAIVDAVTTLEADEGYTPQTVVMLLPTSPHRTAQHIDEAVTLYEVLGAHVTVIGTTMEYPLHELWPTATGVGFRKGKRLRSNGAVQVTSRVRLLDRGEFVQPPTVPYFMDPLAGQDIDTEQEFRTAHEILSREVDPEPDWVKRGLWK